MTNPNNKPGRLNISSEEVDEKFQHRMKAIGEKEKEKVAEAKAGTLGLPYINLAGFPISTEALSIIPEEDARRLRVVCFLYTGRGKEIRFATTDPGNKEVQELYARLAGERGARGQFYYVSKLSMDSALGYYKLIPKPREATKGIKITEEDLKKYQAEIGNFDEIAEKINSAPMTDMMTMIVAAAVEVRSSDIHIEAEIDDIKVRFRVDGVLHDVASLESKVWERLVSRIKLLSGLKINITDKPQDGRFTIHMSKEEIDVRVSTIPTAHGESVVMRLLMSSAVGLQFEDLGLRGKAFEELEREIKKPNGMVITTGPTGSGKTTTLYAVLSKLNTEETKIVTLENPIEYKLKGINQSQIDQSKDYTFAKGLRSILRQDPDVVMVGEIRDFETADTAINAALTGHLVLSTIHTNSASGAIPRFLAMGVKPFLLSPALNAVIGQRLVRRLCQECKKPDEGIDGKKMKEIQDSLGAIAESSGQRPASLEGLKFFAPVGCSACKNLGYRGRVGIYEIMTMNKEISDLIAAQKVSEYEMEEIAVKNGMVTMTQDGLLKAMEGITSVEEVFRVAD